VPSAQKLNGGLVVSIKCEACQRAMVPYHPEHQRFCSRQCSDEFYQAERREAVEWYRAMGLKPELGNGDQRKEAR
jgi:hypothetical protein